MTYTPEQQKANRKLWIEALESGEYQQGKRLLNCAGKFCCLGVLAEVAIDNGLKITKRRGVHEYTVDGKPESPVCYDMNNKYPSARICDFVGLRNKAGLFDESEGYPDNSLAMLNDNHDYSFKQIAKIIRSEPRGLFVEAA